jgi:hypothetical protein
MEVPEEFSPGNEILSHLRGHESSSVAPWSMNAYPRFPDVRGSESLFVTSTEHDILVVLTLSIVACLK